MEQDESLKTLNTIDGLVGANPIIESVWLVDADANVVIGEISDGQVFDRALMPPNLTVMVEANADTESVQFGYGDILVVQTENLMPYSIGDDSGGDYNAYPLPDGWHTIRARPFAADDASRPSGRRFGIDEGQLLAGLPRTQIPRRPVRPLSRTAG